MRWSFNISLALLSATLGLALVWDMGYRVWSLESLLVAMTAILVATALSLLSARSSAILKGTFAVLFFTLIDIFFIQTDWVAWAFLLAGTTIFVVLHKSIQTNFYLVFAVVFIAGLPLKSLSSPNLNQTSPRLSIDAPTQILVHWVLDEMGSFNSVPSEYRVQADIDEITGAYRKRGFTLHFDKPSSSEETYISLSQMLDIAPASPGHKNYVKAPEMANVRIKKNMLHELFAAHQWDVSITQSSYLDFCSSGQFNCVTYDVGNSSYVFSEAGLNWQQRVEILARETIVSLLSEQRGSVIVFSLRNRFPEFFNRYAAWSWARPSLSLAMMDILDNQAKNISSLRGKNYVFAHVLLPHFPWNLDKNCRVLPTDQWRTPYKARSNTSAEDLRTTFQAYWKQQYCTHKRVLSIVDQLDAAHPGRVQFLIHGDHGPRILARHLPRRPSDEALDDVTLKNVVDPFIASRFHDTDETAVAGAKTLQNVVQTLLVGAVRGAPATISQ